MSNSENNYREHIIITSASGPVGGPWIASYTIWKSEDNNSHKAVLQGQISELYKTAEEAHSAATIESRSKLDVLLD